MPRFFDSATVAATAFVGGALVLALTGCAQVMNTLTNQHEENFDSYAAAEEGWVGVEIPSWIPVDATDLRNLATNNEGIAVIRVVTDSPLAGHCETADRLGIPQLDAEWSTEEWPARVERCGDYEVMPMDDGWLGWRQTR